MWEINVYGHIQVLMKKIKQGNLLESTQGPPFRRVVREELSEKATFEQRAK